LNVGENIKKFRQEKSISREALSTILGISIHTLAKYEQGQREPNIETLNKIASALDISVSKLMDESYEAIRNNIDLSLIPTSNLLEELNKRDNFPIKLELKNCES
jgi:transcriptional regulator with XRE-family HTH domain